jgi:hypothetical protein
MTIEEMRDITEPRRIVFSTPCLYCHHRCCHCHMINADAKQRPAPDNSGMSYKSAFWILVISLLLIALVRIGGTL